MNINIRDLKGIYTSRDSKDTNPEYMHDSINITYERDSARSMGFAVEEYIASSKLTPLGTLNIQTIDFINLTSDPIRDKMISYTKRFMVIVNALKDSGNVTYYELWASEYTGNGSYGNFTKVEFPVPVKNYYTDNFTVQVIQEKGEARVLLPTGSFTFRMSGGLLSLVPSTESLAYLYNTENALKTFSTNRDYARNVTGYARRVPVLLYAANKTDFVVFMFLRCNENGNIIQTTDAPVDVLQEFISGTYIPTGTKYNLAGFLYQPVADVIGGSVADNFTYITDRRGINRISTIKNCHIYEINGKKFFIEAVDESTMADSNIYNLKILALNERNTSYYEYFYQNEAAYNTDGHDFRKPVHLMIYNTGNGGLRKSDENGFNSPMDMLVTVTLNEQNEFVSSKRIIDGKDHYLIACTVNKEALSKSVTRLRIYLKERKFLGTDTVEYTEDMMADYYLYKDLNLLQKFEVDFDILESDNTGIALTQMLGTFYDENYELIVNPDKRMSVDGISYALKSGRVYPCAIGGGRIMSDVFYRTNALDVPYGENVSDMVNMNNQLCLVTGKGMVLIYAQKLDSVINFQVKDTLGLIVKDCYDIAETMDGCYVHTRQGIFFTNGYERKNVSEAIADIIEDNYTHGNIFYNSAREELYYCFNASMLYRYRVSRNSWEPMAWTGDSASPNILEVKEDFEGEIVVYTNTSIRKGSLNPSAAYSSIRFQTMDLESSSMMKNLVSITLDIDVGMVKSDGSSSITLYFGLKKGNKDPLTGEVEAEGILYPSVAIPIQALGGDGKWVNTVTGRRTLNIPIPLERQYWIVPDPISETNESILTDIQQTEPDAENPGHTKPKASDMTLPMRIPSDKITLHLNARNISFRLYNVEINYEFLSSINPVRQRTLGYGTYYGRKYGIHL